MIPNVRRGREMVRLIKYLVGPGKRNEHVDPHLVAGSPWLMAWHAEAELTHADAKVIGEDLEVPAKGFDAKVTDGHVWHCSLSLDAGEGRLADDEWAQIAERFMTRMGFICDDAEQPSLRWVAIRHGVSAKGNDHIHLAVNLVHEDGSIADVFRDWKRAQAVCRALETEHGLQQVGMNGRSCRGYKPGEIEAEASRRARASHSRAHAQGREPRAWAEIPKPERDRIVEHFRPREAVRWTLSRQVRACAAAAEDEAEFVRRVRRQGLLIRPRFAQGTQEVVVGYRVALRPRLGERPIWYGGGHLSHDLSLPRLREGWPDTPQAALDASAEWRAAWRGVRVAAPGREASEPTPGLAQHATRDLDELRGRLREISLNDHAEWSRVARQAAGALASWSVAVEQVPGPLAAAADALTRSAELRRPPVVPKPGSARSPVNAALILAAVGKSGKARDRALQLMLLRQFVALGQAIGKMHQALGDVRRAEHIHHVMTSQLEPMLHQLMRTAPPPARDVEAELAGAATGPRLPAAVYASRPPQGSVIPPALPAEQPTPRRHQIHQPVRRGADLGR